MATENQENFEKCIDLVLSEIADGEIADSGEAFVHLAFIMVSRFKMQGSRAYVREIHEALSVRKNMRL